jgi:Protein of unknown function (DUF2905)
VTGEQPARTVEGAFATRSGAEEEREQLLAGKRGRAGAGEPFPRPFGEREVAYAEGLRHQGSGSSGKHVAGLGYRQRKIITPMATSGAPIRTLLFLVGIVFLVAAIAWPILSKYLGRLPGDVVVRRPGFTFVFPIVTCLVLSLLFSLLFWIFRR